MEQTENKMSSSSIKRLIWTMGLPMVVSMVLQALYNIVDTAFVINMGEGGINANLALTYAFPVQIFMIAIGVGTGIGINSLLSRSLGQNNKAKVGKTVGNGLFLGMVMYLVFMLFGLFVARAFITMQANGNQEAIEMGSQYLMIVCTMSFGQVGYTIYERFLLSSGKTVLSTIGQIAGALTNIVLDYVFIYPLHMGVVGAAYATVIGQCVSLALDMVFHYALNKDVRCSFRDILPDRKTLSGIMKLGVPAMIMQALLSVMMLGVNMILGTSSQYALLQGSFGIYYKIQQIPLFSAFGMSNALISIVSFNYGTKQNGRVREAAKYGVIDTILVGLFFLILFEALATPIANLFGMASGDQSPEIASTVTTAIRIASIGYIFMAASVGIQGVLQGLRYIYAPLIISFLRLIVLVFPLVYLFSLCDNASTWIWAAFPVSELITSGVSLVLMKRGLDKKAIIIQDARPQEKTC